MFFKIDDFIEQVKSGFFTDYDGFGEAWESLDSQYYYEVECNVQYLTELKNIGVKFVMWYNK